MDDKQKILIVDDDIGICQTLEDILSLEGYDCSFAESGAAALRIAQEIRFDAVLIDLKLPDISGIDLMAKLLDLDSSMVFFVITGNASVRNAVEALKKGATDYFIKPLVLDKLLHSLSSSLELKKTKRALQKSRKQIAVNYEAQVVINNLLHLALGDSTLDEILQKTLDLLVNISWISFEGKGAIFLVDEAKENLLIKVHRGFNVQQLQMCTEVPFGHCICGMTALSKKAQFVSCKGHCAEKNGQYGHDHKHYCIPIILNDEVEGVINLNVDPEYASESAELDFLANVANTLSGIIKREKIELSNEELKQQTQQTQRLEGIGTLAGGIAHDFNNILTAIIGFSELSLTVSKKDSQLYGYLSQILSAGGRARDLVSQILTFSRKGSMNKQPLIITPIIKETIKLLRSSIPSNISIELQASPEQIYVMADPTQIHQVVMNLCTNAFHAIQRSGGTITIIMKTVSVPDEELCVPVLLVPGNYVEIDVCDNGIGIKPELVDHIFEPYYTTKEKGKGTGLGLSVAHGIVKSHGGEITVESKPGKGSKFSVFLPAIEPTVIEPLDFVADQDLPKGTETILLVDDEPEIVFVNKHILNSLGYTVVDLTSSLEALDVFGKSPEKFDLVISDISMPDMTGDQLCTKLLSIRKNIPVILCTGYSELINSEKAQIIGAKKLIYKPIVKRDLALLVREVLEGN